MRLQVLSDLHIEAHNNIPPLAPGADVVVLAGDLAPVRPSILQAVAEQWQAARHILYVPGNHEFYGGEIDAVRAALAAQCAEIGIELLDRHTLPIDRIRFIGATLWTDFALFGVAEQVRARAIAKRGMADFTA